MRDAEYLNRLIKLQVAYAVEALKTPQKKNSYEYGLHAGVVKGIEKSINELQEMLKEEKRADV